MTNEEIINVLTLHKENWERLIREHIAEKQEGNKMIEALGKAIETLKNKPDYDIVFLCDGKACGENHDCMECRHTLDIHHAKNFHYNPILFDKNYYLEVDDEQTTI